ncbi:splicing factor, Prp19-binding domain-containing protein [Staphylotrichum tortipilum]|uniref:Splicing factor, Prp19-binding domain-containing protein n=1 Tax=Staphylotrichum tortipilum TaxID=2831512 RepID=A0AAN6MGP8_9PEZI|nr:splicing factor, Prp19-binding domain-containing protein [Staphylotrichum longicolle]
MPPPNRMTANPVKPARYRAGKAAAPESSSESEGSGSENEDETKKKAPPRRTAPPPKFASATGAGRIISRGYGAKIDLKGVVSRDAEAEEARRQAAKAARLAAEKKAKEEGFVTEGEEEEGSEESGSEEDSSEEESSSSEEEAPRRLMMRPKFIPKSQRQAAASSTTTEAPTTTTTTSHPAPSTPSDAAALAQARLLATDELIEAQIKKDLAARAAGKKHWESSSAGSNSDAEVDDTDDLDPAAEYAAWKLRELHRLRRERDAIESRERDLAEVERRRNLTEDERRAEDEAHMARQREEKELRGKMGFMQKYFHKGAFYQEESKAAGLDKRDLAGARFADDVNRELLPKALQMRDMTKVGKKGATRYRDLQSEDTGQWGGLAGERGGRRGGVGRDVDERFQPDGGRGGWERDGGDGGKGANAIPLGERRERDRGGERGERERYRERSMERERDDRRDRRRSRSRSRSPRHERGDRRKRSPSRERERDRYESDKRRRVDAR